MTSRDATALLNERSLGDLAVDGLMAGMSAGLVMALFLLVTGLVRSQSPTVIIGRFDPAQGQNIVTGLLTHLAVSAIYGVIFGLLLPALMRLRPSLVRFGWLTGLVYGLALYGIARSAFWAGVESGLVQFTAVILLLAHAVYGLVLGFLISRKWG